MPLVFLYISCHYDKMSSKHNLNVEGFTGVHSLRTLPITVEEAWQREHEAAGCIIIRNQEAEEEVHWFSALSPLSIYCGTPAHRMVLPVQFTKPRNFLRDKSRGLSSR